MTLLKNRVDLRQGAFFFSNVTDLSGSDRRKQNTERTFIQSTRAAADKTPTNRLSGSYIIFDSSGTRDTIQFVNAPATRQRERTIFLLFREGFLLTFIIAHLCF